MARYFFSYAGIDRPIAAQIITGLQGTGIDVFWDQQGIGWGDNWQNKLAQELETCTAYILLLGPHGIRRWVSPEVQAALIRHYEEELPIFILLHPEVDRSQIPLFLSFSQHRSLPVNLNDANFFQILVSELKEQVGEVEWQPDVLPEGFCPYPGLESFSADYQKYFFGRQQETAELLTQFVMYKQRWLQIEGNSGVGKSSLVMSGLLPAIKAGWLDDDGPRQNWHSITMRPGKDPCENLAVALRTALESISHVDLTNDIAKIRNVESANTLSGPGQAKASDLAYAIKCALPKSSNSQFFLVVDQLEEAITLTTNELYRTRFDALLAAAIIDNDCPFHLVTTIRSDFLLKFSELPELQKALQQSTRYFLKPIGGMGLRDAVTTPLRRAKDWGWPSHTHYHQASQRPLTLPETIVADALSERDAALPLASNLMNRLWAKALEQGRRQPSFEDYYTLGGIGGALAQTMDIQLGKLSDLEKAQARNLLLALVQDNDNAPATRRTINKSQAINEVAKVSAAKKSAWVKRLLSNLRRGYGTSHVAPAENPERILDWLSGIPVDDIKTDPVRMIVISGGLEKEAVAGNAQQANDQKTVDLIHEVLLRKSRATNQAYCKTLSQWVADNRQQLKNRNLRKQLTQRWLVAKQKSLWSALFNDLANPKQIRDFLAAGSCDEDEKRFIKASLLYTRVINASMASLVLLFISLGFNANGVNFITQKTNLIDLPVAWLRAQWGWKKYPEVVNIPAGTLPIEDQTKTIPAFRMGETEVTFAEYDVFVFSVNPAYTTPWSEVQDNSANPCLSLPDSSGWGRGSRPVINVSWNCAQVYINWLNAGLTAKQPHYHLPSEAQWEYAIRAGTTTDYFWEASALNGSSPNATAHTGMGRAATLDPTESAVEYAWFSKNSNDQTHPVKQLKPNGFQLYDMAGNVWEWVQDCYAENDENAPKDDSAEEPKACEMRVLRGGSWDITPNWLRSAFRTGFTADFRFYSIGFRLAQD